MKMLVVTPMLPKKQPTNALPLVTHTLVTGLAARHAVTLLTVAGPDPDDRLAIDELRASGIDVDVVWRTEPYDMDRRTRWWQLASAWLRSRYPLRTIWFREPSMQRLIDHRLARTSFDLIQLEDNAVAAYRYGTATPVILTEHEVRRPRPVRWRRERGMSWRQWTFAEADWHRWRHYQRAVWHRFDRILVFTPRDAAAIRTIIPALASRVRVNPFGVEIPSIADPTRAEDGTIVFVGGFSHQPNVDAVLWLGHEIMPLLRMQYPRVRLLLVGSHPPAAVSALAGGDIIVTGRVAEIDPFLERAAVVVAPLRIGGGMRMKVLQGMARGKAVVTTSVGAAGLAADGEEPPVIIAEDAAAFARATAALLDSPEARRDLGTRARSFVAEHYSATAYLRRLETIYAELVPDPKQRGHEQRPEDNSAATDRHHGGTHDTMTAQYSVSVVIPTYERCASVLRALEALGRQTLPPCDYEVIVSIDGSSDGTREAVERFAAAYRVRALWQPNRGRAAACNAGIRAATGEVVILLDDDMEPLPGFLLAHRQAHPHGSRLGIMGAVPIALDRSSAAVTEYIGGKFNAHLEKLASPGYDLNLRDFYSGNFSIRRAVLLEVGGFDEGFRIYGNEDLELSIRLKRAGVQLRYSAEPVARQHYTKGFAALARDNIAKGRTAVLLVGKHPESFADSRLGGYRRASRKWRLLRSALIAASARWGRMPDVVISFIEWLEKRRPPRLHRYYNVALDYFFWVGVRAALRERASAGHGTTSPRELVRRSRQ